MAIRTPWTRRESAPAEPDTTLAEWLDGAHTAIEPAPWVAPAVAFIPPMPPTGSDEARQLHPLETVDLGCLLPSVLPLVPHGPHAACRPLGEIDHDREPLWAQTWADVRADLDAVPSVQLVAVSA